VEELNSILYAFDVSLIAAIILVLTYELDKYK
jgi:hypothetical protein